MIKLFFTYYNLKWLLRSMIIFFLVSSAIVDDIKKYLDFNFDHIELIDSDAENQIEEDTDDKIYRWNKLSLSGISFSIFNRDAINTFHFILKYKNSPPTPPPDLIKPRYNRSIS